MPVNYEMQVWSVCEEADRCTQQSMLLRSKHGLQRRLHHRHVLLANRTIDCIGIDCFQEMIETPPLHSYIQYEFQVEMSITLDTIACLDLHRLEFRRGFLGLDCHAWPEKQEAVQM